MTDKPHYFGHGRIAYMQIPALDVRVSSAFYKAVFGWEIRSGRDSRLSFTDTTGDMIGAFVTHLMPVAEPGVMPYIYVRGLGAALERVAENGGVVVKPPYVEEDIVIATFKDPAGNLMGAWERA